MNYYEHHIGDYDSATAHLSLLEDAVYRRLICLYYRTEQPLPTDVKAVARLIRAVSKRERDTVAMVLGEFFEGDETGWHNARCDDEIARFQDKQAKARRSARARWDADQSDTEGNANASPNAMRTHTEGNANASPNAMRTHTEGNAPRARPQTPDTIPKDQEHELPYGNSGPSSAKNADAGPATRSDPIPYQAVVDAYNATMTGLPKVRELTPKRRTLIRAAWRASPQRSDLRFWTSGYFAECQDDDFTNGAGPYRNGNAGWQPNFDYLMRPEVITRMYERAMDRMERKQ